MRILAIETAVPPGSVWVGEPSGTHGAYRELQSTRRTTELFAFAVRSALDELGWSPSSIDLVATSLGPGSFTGLRIGITAAKTFAYAAACDVLAVNTLEVIASQARFCGEIVSLLDAQRKQLFAATFERSADTLACCSKTGVVTVAELLARLMPHQLLIGSGLKHLTEFLTDHPLVADESIWAPRADTLGEVAAAKYAAGVRHDVWSLNPEYFRRSAAEEKANAEARLPGT